MSEVRTPSARQVAALVAVLAAAVASRARAELPPGPGAAVARPGDDLIDLGRAIFFDRSLSEPAGTSCASCHDPERAFSGDNGSAVGVPRGSRAGRLARRTSPSLLYLRYIPAFHYFQDDEAAQPAPFGGLFWDGRVDTIAQLARQPLLNPNEMNNHDGRAVAAKIKKASYADRFARAFGAGWGDGEATLAGVGKALEAFLTADEMAPFSSRFDAFLRKRGKLSPYEMQGMRVFKNNCASCHLFYETGRDPALSLFTNFGYDAVAPPHNPHLPPAAKPDLGLCERTDKRIPSSDPANCVSFRTPSLRNVAVRVAYMHNGAFSNLRDAVAFYATRATDPRRWYKSGVVFEDVPKKFRGLVNTTSVPYNRRPGDSPALNDREIDAVVAFLHTLTEARYQPVAALGSPPSAPTSHH